MARRHSSKSQRPTKSKPRGVNRNEGKLKRWNKLSDIPLDEEDQFHASRDKILLEGDGFRGDEDDGDEDEVFGLKGVSDSEEDAGGEEDNEDLDEDGELDVDELPVSMKKQLKKKAVKSKKTSSAHLSSSSSEDLGSDEEEETWGHNKSAYYSSNAAQLESDDEEANELEEQEARRLQSKARGVMVEDDFGLGDSLDGISRTGDDIDHLVEHAPPVIEPLPQDKKSLIRHLEKTSPETLALARDWEETAWNLSNTQRKLEQLEEGEPDALSLGMIHLHYQTLLTYATTLAFYLHLRASEKYAQRPELLKEHPILGRLLTLKQSLSTLEELDFAISDEEDDDDEGLEDGDAMLDASQLWHLDRMKGLEQDELEDLLMDAQEVVASKPVSKATDEPPAKKRKKTSAESRKKTKQKDSLPVFDLIEPAFAPSKSSSSSASTQPDSGVTDAYGESTLLQHADAADKSARKKSLRFHTAKIESASARRAGARNSAAGGDDDLPYRERRKEKEAREAKEAKARVKGQGGDDLDDVEPVVGRPDKKRRREEEEDGDDGGEAGVDGYYELVKRKVKESKEKKKADYEAAQAAARPDFGDADNAVPEGQQRSVTRAILANKGLTPHRSKSVRNPRVKKRQKFEKAKKKVASQKAVYKGGIGDSGKYDGEKSGISKVVKSVRLG